MALIGNHSVLTKSPLRFINFREGLLRSNFNKPGMIRGAGAGEWSLSALPYGHLSPSAWMLPQTGGAMASYGEAGLTVGASGAGAMGINIEGAASFSICFADAAGQLIVSGAGTASFSISATGSAIATLNGSGSASMAFGASGTIGALAWAYGDASMTFSGSLTPYGVGNMQGTTDVSTEITNDSVANAVWSAIASTFNVSGTMGAKLNAASAGGVDYAALAAAILAAAEAAPIASNIKEVNSIAVDGAGTEADPFGPV